MKAYIGAKIIQAEPQGFHAFNQQQGRDIGDAADREGYRVHYPDGYVSWSPKHVFEECYREVNDGEIELIEGLD